MYHILCLKVKRFIDKIILPVFEVEFLLIHSFIHSVLCAFLIFATQSMDPNFALILHCVESNV